MTGPQDPAASDRARLRAGHADREQVTGVLKNAFTQGRLTSDELDARTSQALAARTYAELDALIADLPGPGELAASPVPVQAEVPDPFAPGQRWPLAVATVKSGAFVGIAAVIAISGNMIDNADPNGYGPGPHHGWTRLMLLLTFALLITALVILIRGVAASVEQRRSRKQLPPPPGPASQVLEAGRHDSTGQGPVPPGPRPGQAHTEMRANPEAFSA
jgi:Domain of unknown function (DUF1707)